MTSALNEPKPSLDHVRNQIDELDQRIVALIAERQKWVLVAGSLKTDEQAVRAPDRVQHVINKVRHLAEQSGAAPDVVEQTYRALIDGFIDLELKHTGY